MASSTSDTGSSSGQGGPRFALLAQVRAYWQGLRQGTALPTRDKIDPRGIAEALESTFLLERIAPGVARFRIAGLHLHDLIGHLHDFLHVLDGPRCARHAAVDPV